MKSFTDLEQSKKLAEILPLESADMCYIQDLLAGCKYGEYRPYIGNIIPAYGQDKIKCWSLAALLSILPYKIELSHDVIDANGNIAYKNECYKFSINRCGLFGDKWNVQYYGKHQRQLGERYKELYIDLLFSENYNNPIDACYEMIIKLHELKML